MASQALKIVQYVDRDTGETFEKRSYVDLQFTENGYLFWNRKKNIKTFLDVPLPKQFSWAEKGRIEELKHYILRDNQFLVYRSGNTIKPLAVDNIMKILGMSERQCKSLIKKMKTFNVIKEIKFGDLTYFAFNPLYGLKDKRLTLNVYLFFQDDLKEILPKWVIDKFVSQANDIQPHFEIIK
jgi:hypothetical protein